MRQVIISRVAEVMLFENARWIHSEETYRPDYQQKEQRLAISEESIRKNFEMEA